MNRCYILGAGFSKAVADLPVMKEMISTFERIREQKRKLGEENYVHWGDRIFNYLERENGQTFNNCNFKENLEALVSFIDLNLSGQIRASFELGELRRCIQTYLYLALIGPFLETTLLRLFIEQLAPGDTLITFNYDLVVETALYKKRLWNPSDGYGLVFKAPERVSQSSKFKTQISLYKLHGSLNWDSSPLRLRYFYNDNRSPIFPGYHEPCNPSASPYQGKDAGNWLMPSFVKDFSVPGLLNVWAKAFDAVRRAEEVIIIGYSLPEADSAACLLLGTSGIADKCLTLVNPEAQSLRERYSLITGKSRIVSYVELGQYLNSKRGMV